MILRGSERDLLKKRDLKAYGLLLKVRKEKPVVHHLTNWVSIYDCANVVKVLGASPVMAHAYEEAADMTGIASSLVLNIGTLTQDLIRSMKVSAVAANKKGIPVVLDVCGAGATKFRDKSCFELINGARIDIIKGNASEIARIAGERVKTKGVDSTEVGNDMRDLTAGLAALRKCTIVVTGKEDLVSDGKRTFVVKNGVPVMGSVVGTGCMAASVIGAFAAVCDDPVRASVSGLVCFEVAAELAAKKARGPASFKEMLFDRLYSLDEKSLGKLEKVYA